MNSLELLSFTWTANDMMLDSEHDGAVESGTGTGSATILMCGGLLAIPVLTPL